MQVRLEQLEQHLSRGLKPLYTLHGDEPLLAQEAADCIRAAARAAGCSERKVFVVSGAHFDWSGVLGAAQALSLFAERQLIEIRIPSGKPGKDGGEALQRYCSKLSEDVVTLVHLPKLDWQALKSGWFGALDAAGVSIRLETLARSALPQWLVQRLKAQGQRVHEGEAGQRTLSFLADRVEGNLLAAHQEIQKLGLLHPPGALSFEQVEAAVLNVARHDITHLSEALWTGQVARVLRLLDSLEAAGESPVAVHWNLADDVRTLARARSLLDTGRPLPLALKEARAWGAKEKLFERALPLVARSQFTDWLMAAAVCDGINKGLKHPEWPLEPWPALRRWLLLMLEVVQAGASGPRRAQPGTGAAAGVPAAPARPARRGTLALRP